MNQPPPAQFPKILPDQEGLLQRSYDQLQTALGVGLIATWFWDIGHDKVYGN